MKKGLKQLLSITVICSGGTTVFAAYNLLKGNEKFYADFVVPIAHKLDPEVAHNLAIKASKYDLIPHPHFQDPPSLQVKLWNTLFNNPIGMAAGFDKQGEAVQGLHKLGFGFVEIGSVTPKPQPGNSKPRVFRLVEDEAIINRYGFNSEGHEAVYERLVEIKNNKDYVVGVNLGKNKLSEDPIRDYVEGIVKFGEIADYLVINISSPNTPGLRDWQHHNQLKVLLCTLVATRNNLPSSKPPLLLKLSPDLTPQERHDIAYILALKECKVDGLIISNTTVQRDQNLICPDASESGGLSGKPLCAASTHLIKDMYCLTKGTIPIIGVGGVFSGKDAYEKIRAGASLIQLYTAYIYHGPPRITKIKQELDHLLKADGYNNITEVIGKDAQGMPR